MKQLERLGTQNIAHLLREFSIPAIIGTVVNALYNVVDRLFIGLGCGRDAIAGIGLSFPFMIILVAFGTLVGVGSGALLSIKLGERDRVAAEKVLAQFITVTLIIFLTLPFVGVSFLDHLLERFGGTPEAIPYARQYLRIVLFGNVFAHLSFGTSNLIRAEGNAKRSMACMLTGAILNIILDPIFIFGFGMGVAGAAWATNIAMFCSAAYALWHYVSGQSIVRLRLRRAGIYPRMLVSVFAIGLSPFAIQIMTSLVTIAFNRSFLRWSPDSADATAEIAAMSIANGVIFLLLMPVFGLTQGMQPIVGYNYGAQLYPRVNAAYRHCMKIATLFGLVISLVSIFAAWPIVRCFTHDPHLIAVGTRGLRIYGCAYIAVGAPMTTIAYFQAVGRPAFAIGLSLLRQGGMLLPLIILLPRVWGVPGIWAAAPCSDILAAIVTTVVIIIELRHLRRLSGTTDPSRTCAAN